MPIRPENKNLYPKDWKEIRERVLKRAKNKCEKCGVKNYAIGYRNKEGKFIKGENSKQFQAYCDYWEFKIIKIILTTAHLDHDPTNNKMKNLKAFCQKCHNGYDAKMRAQGIKNRRHKAAGQMDFLKN